MASSQLPAAHQSREMGRDVEREARQVANNPWLTLFARFGYAAKGIVYLIIGGLAAAAATGRGGTTTDQYGVIHAIYVQPLGRFLLVVVAIGWLGFALWSEMQAAIDTDRRGTDAKGIVVRVAYAVIGITYAGLAIAALRLVAGAGGAGQNSTAQTQSWTTRLLAHGWGVALVIVAGLVVLVIAGALFYRAYSAEFRGRLNLGLPGGGDWVVWLGRLGYASLGLVFAVIGLFLIVAAAQHNPSQAKGLDSALHALTQQPLGQVTLAVVALGLICYGLYSIAEARYRRVTAA